MIELINVNKIYQTTTRPLHALKDINLKVNAGEIFGIIGKSGAGKSSLIRCVNLLEKPTSGDIIVNQQHLLQLNKQQLLNARHEIGMIFQQFNLLNSRTVFENIALPLELAGHNKKYIIDTIRPLLELTELTDKIDYYPSQLSGGQKQRVALARALVHKPKVLLCDEATSALDPQTTKSILQLLKNINQQLGLTILLITHEVEVIKEICHQVALIDEGEIVEQESLIEFFTHPKTELAKDYVKLALKYTIPEPLKNRLQDEKFANSHALLRINFYGKSAGQPLITEIAHQFDISLNILQANMEFLQDSLLGHMLVEVITGENQLAEILQFLQRRQVNVEVIGYV